MQEEKKLWTPGDDETLWVPDSARKPQTEHIQLPVKRTPNEELLQAVERAQRELQKRAKKVRRKRERVQRDNQRPDQRSLPSSGRKRRKKK